MTGSPHAGRGSALLFPNPLIQPESSKNWDIGVNVFKESMLFSGDRFAMKVGYFDNRIDDMMFMMVGVDLPRTAIEFNNLANVNNLKQVRYRGVEYQLEYDVERVYAGFTYTRMIGSNDFCARNSYMGGAIKRRGLGGGLYEWSEDSHSNNWVTCGAIMGAAAYAPADRGSLTLGARFMDRALDVGVRARYSAGFGNDLDKGVYRQKMDLAAWPAYTAYDLYGTYAVNKRMDVLLSLENFTDEAYFVPKADFENIALARGRTLTGTIQYKF